MEREHRERSREEDADEQWVDQRAQTEAQVAKLLDQSSDEDFTYESMTVDTLVQAAPLAAARLVHIVETSSDERAVLTAAKEILNRVLGLPSKYGADASRNPMDELLTGIVD